MGDDFALRTGYEAVAPELDAVGLAGRVGLKTYTVYGDNGQTVGYGVTALYGYPCTQLAHLFFLSVGAFPADGSGVNQQFSTFQGHDTGSFRVPLVPANLHAELTDGGLDGFES